MAKKGNVMSDSIRDYWESQAKKHGVSHEASWGDNLAIALEIETISGHLKDGDEVLDVGCANGYSAFQQIQRHRFKKLVGVDFAAGMIKAAQEAATALKLDSNVKFSEGDVRKLLFEDASFDVVYTTRTLINLPSWEEQVQGILECLRVTRPGGKVILSEAFWEPLVLLNSLRALRQLPPLVEHDFNRYLKKSKLETLFASLRLQFGVEEFSSIYYLGSRFLRELVTGPATCSGYSNPFNKIFYEIEREYSSCGCGIQQAYTIHKP